MFSVDNTFQYVNVKMSSFHVLPIVLTVVLALIPASNASCSDIHPNLNLTLVASMCTDSVVTGRNVYIDTRQAETMLLTPGTICTCQAELLEGTYNISVNYTGITESQGCGSFLHFQTDHSNRNVTCEMNLGSMFKNIRNVTVDYHTVSASVTDDFCVQLQQDICADNEFRCTDGTCISGDLWCNNIPDCTDGSDEDNCPTICSEGQLLCDNQETCISKTQRCDGKENCPDGSDESIKYCVNGAVTNDTSPTPEKSFITVTCRKVQQRSTTTLASTTTPTPTTLVEETTARTTTVSPAPVTTLPHTGSTPMVTDPLETSNANIGLIVGLVVSIVCIALIVAAAVYCRKNYANNMNARKLHM